jgi:choline/ethanolamine phosphotransferase
MNTARTNNWQSTATEAIQRLPNVLTTQEITRLREHRYASEGTTLLDPYMQRFWKWLVEYCPLWVAPNLITIVGLAINIATSILLLIYTKGATEQVRSLLDDPNRIMNVVLF